MKVAIIDYGVGNLTSVFNAIEFVEGTAFVTGNPKELETATHIILPGVGAFGDGMTALNESGWTDAIREQALNQQKPFLGICLGMQVLSSFGHEHGVHEGLGLIAGDVEKMVPLDKNVRIPHIGWNMVQVSKVSQMYKDIPDADFYFVHSYVMKPLEQSVVNGTCTHGSPFVASVERGNVWGTQFHPEKSQGNGLKILKNFISL